ncbi:hypothetical protein BDV95DRAFT_174590 [Massariosphaeria phaeospora]|uniref:Uncharacterized protein n=1 Tax=Massariosphaeria phaeospora TaxID=100035 RepID=A0A7C8M3X8_9PLEO|nr:hypothetical protein BDV95DRAFT_174590 [Massariosphaeria phaeospora]
MAVTGAPPGYCARVALLIPGCGSALKAPRPPRALLLSCLSASTPPAAFRGGFQLLLSAFRSLIISVRDGMLSSEAIGFLLLLLLSLISLPGCERGTLFCGTWRYGLGVRERVHSSTFSSSRTREPTGPESRIGPRSASWAAAESRMTPRPLTLPAESTGADSRRDPRSAPCATADSWMTPRSKRALCSLASMIRTAPRRHLS